MENVVRFAPVLKNMRGTIYFEPDTDVSGTVSWVSRRYRYRNVGVAPSLIENVSQQKVKDKLGKAPFVALFAPTESIRNFLEICFSVVEMPRHTVETVFLASCYVSSLQILGPRSVEKLRPLVAASMGGPKELPDVEEKRNLRLTEYAVLDSHVTTATDAHETARAALVLSSKEAEKELDRFVRRRRKVAAQDCKTRFWRLDEATGRSERDAVLYLDPFRIVTENWSLLVKHKEFRRLFTDKNQDLARCFALLAAFVLRDH